MVGNMDKEGCYNLAFQYAYLITLGLNDSAEIVNAYLRTNPEGWKFYCNCLWTRFGMIGDTHWLNVRESYG